MKFEKYWNLDLNFEKILLITNKILQEYICKIIYTIFSLDKTAGVRLSDLVVIIELFGPIKSSQDNKCVLIHNVSMFFLKKNKNSKILIIELLSL